MLTPAIILSVLLPRASSSPLVNSPSAVSRPAPGSPSGGEPPYALLPSGGALPLPRLPIRRKASSSRSLSGNGKLPLCSAMWPPHSRPSTSTSCTDRLHLLPQAATLFSSGGVSIRAYAEPLRVRPRSAPRLPHSSRSIPEPPSSPRSTPSRTAWIQLRR
ncbi:hypothetical protein U9M48_027076 [Paspalum notatum var. saurae]|uniref:Secreted protein n=1 Tax=Paspalum notatum var. saurae TaxID=547442 RepID=A0AAQ3TU63_PASNO